MHSISALPVTATAKLPSPARPWMVATAALGTCVAVNLADPNEAGHYPTCPFLAVTGLQCPGCGTLRAIRALTRGDVLAAVGLNVLTVAMIPVLLWAWSGWVAHARGRRTSMPTLAPRVGMAVAVVIPLFWVARNIPVAPLTWLAP